MDIFSNLGGLLNQNIFVAIIITLLGGIVASFSPCCLSTLPLIIGYVGNDSSKKGLKYSIFFSLGIIVTFTLLGILTVKLGTSFRVLGSLWYYILAIILIYVTLQLFDVIKSKNKEYCPRPKLRRGVIGAFFLGILGGVFDSPCSTPILVVILTYISNQGNILLGALLMAVYSLGHCILIIIAGTSLDVVNKLSSNQKYMKIGQILKIIFGIITLLMALYLLYIAF